MRELKGNKGKNKGRRGKKSKKRGKKEEMRKTDGNKREQQEKRGETVLKYNINRGRKSNKNLVIVGKNQLTVSINTPVCEYR